MAEPVWSNTGCGVQCETVRASEIWVRRGVVETWLHLSVDNVHAHSFLMPNEFADRLGDLLKGEVVGKSENKKMAEHCDRVVSYLRAAKKLLTGSSVGDWGAQEIEIAKMIQAEARRAESK